MFLQKIIHQLHVLFRGGEKQKPINFTPFTSFPEGSIIPPAFHIWFSTFYHALIFACLHVRVVNTPRSNAQRNLSYSFCRKVVWGPFLVKALGAEFAVRYLGYLSAPQLRRLSPGLGHELLRGMPGLRSGWVDLPGDFMLGRLFFPR